MDMKWNMHVLWEVGIVSAREHIGVGGKTEYTCWAGWVAEVDMKKFGRGELFKENRLGAS
jgi:hypothetical protein